MATQAAPEKINIKRRRNEEPVDHLLYQSKKQRTTNHIFVRVHANAEKASPANDRSQNAGQSGPSVPSIRTTQPGDEVRDFEKYKASLLPHFASLKNPTDSKNTPAEELFQEIKSDARRFHLTRDLSTSSRPQSPAGVRKNKYALRPHLPTFVERLRATNQVDDQVYVKKPVDRIVRVINGQDHSTDNGQGLLIGADVEKRATLPFNKPQPHPLKTGTSINDDIETWDIESDQLADELAELALEMDPEAKAAFLKQQEIERQQQLASHRPASQAKPDVDDFVYEMYVRVKQGDFDLLAFNPHSNSYGYLIIDEDEEGLWEQYLNDEDDDDEDWNEEDEDSNAEDNPRNEYPDEDVSSDDEFGRNVYRYRRYCSDDEHFDEDYS